MSPIEQHTIPVHFALISYVQSELYTKTYNSQNKHTRKNTPTIAVEKEFGQGHTHERSEVWYHSSSARGTNARSTADYCCVPGITRESACGLSNPCHVEKRHRFNYKPTSSHLWPFLFFAHRLGGRAHGATVNSKAPSMGPQLYRYCLRLWLEPGFVKQRPKEPTAK